MYIYTYILNTYILNTYILNTYICTYICTYIYIHMYIYIYIYLVAEPWNYKWGNSKLPHLPEGFLEMLDDDSLMDGMGYFQSNP